MPEEPAAAAVHEPTAGRPIMPDGYGLPVTDEGMLTWDQAKDWLERALTYWVGSTRPDGRPHASPIWGAWVDNCFYMEGSRATRRGRNIAANPAVNIHIEFEGACVMVDGTASEITHPDSALATRLVDAFGAKYEPTFNYRPNPTEWDGGGLYVVRPQVVLAWKHFPGDAARWTF